MLPCFYSSSAWRSFVSDSPRQRILPQSIVEAHVAVSTATARTAKRIWQHKGESTKLLADATRSLSTAVTSITLSASQTLTGRALTGSRR